MTIPLYFIYSCFYILSYKCIAATNTATTTNTTTTKNNN